MSAAAPFPYRCLVRRALDGVTALVLAACGSMAGVGGSAEYGCKAPAGVKCDSVSGTYANALQHTLPGQRPPPAAPAVPGATSPPAGAKTGPARPLARASASPTALRSEARVLRLWIKPWEDSDGALHDQGFVYLQVDSGRWLVEHAQRQVRARYAPVRPPRSAAAPADTGANGATGATGVIGASGPGPASGALPGLPALPLRPPATTTGDTP